MTTETLKIHVPGNHLMAGLLGEQDEYLRMVERAFDRTEIHVRGNEISIEGGEALRCAGLFDELVALMQDGHRLEPADLERMIELAKVDESLTDLFTTEVLRTGHGKVIRPKSVGQKRYVETIQENVITFGLGPAGTGKSWLAVAMAVRALKDDEVERILLTRPAVEAGERLGFLPGDLMAKIDPYLKPLYDALYDMFDPAVVPKLLERGQVEVAPLAFMRGRTLNGSFIILDEAQNTTAEQMKMFLTRIGFGSKAVITGDTTQVDMPEGRSGLDGLEKVLGGIEGVGFIRLESRDVVRHRIVQDIVDAYDRADADPRAR